MISSCHTICHISHIQQDLQADIDDEHDILLDQSNEVDSFLPTSVSALEPTVFIYSVTIVQRAYLKPFQPSKRRGRRPVIQKRDWAHVIDVNTPLANFHELVPEMAHKVFNFFNSPIASNIRYFSIHLNLTHSKNKLCII